MRTMQPRGCECAVRRARRSSACGKQSSACSWRSGESGRPVLPLSRLAKASAPLVLLLVPSAHVGELAVVFRSRKGKQRPGFRALRVPGRRRPDARCDGKGGVRRFGRQPDAHRSIRAGLPNRGNARESLTLRQAASRTGLRRLVAGPAVASGRPAGDSAMVPPILFVPGRSPARSGGAHDLELPSFRRGVESS